MAFVDVSSMLNISFFDILALFSLFTLCFIKPKSEPEEPGSDYVKIEMRKSDKITSKIEERLLEIREDWKQTQTDARLMRERARYLRKLAKSKRPHSETDAELQEADETIFKEVLGKYLEKKLEKKSRKSRIDKDPKENSKKISKKDSGEKSKKKSKKDLEEGSNA